MRQVTINGDELKLSTLNRDNIEQLISFNKLIYSSILHKSYFIPPKYFEYEDYLRYGAKVYLLFKENQLIAYSSLTFHQEYYENWKKDFLLQPKEIKKCAKLDSIAISDDYRHKHIFSFFENKFVEYLKTIGYNTIVAHVHPENKRSLNYFLNHGYKVIKKGKFQNSVRFFLKKKI